MGTNDRDVQGNISPMEHQDNNINNIQPDNAVGSGPAFGSDSADQQMDINGRTAQTGSIRITPEDIEQRGSALGQTGSIRITPEDIEQRGSALGQTGSIRITPEDIEQRGSALGQTGSIRVTPEDIERRGSALGQTGSIRVTPDDIEYHNRTISRPIDNSTGYGSSAGGPAPSPTPMRIRPEEVIGGNGRYMPGKADESFAEPVDDYREQFDDWYQQPQSGYQPQSGPQDMYQEPMGGYQPGSQGMYQEPMGGYQPGPQDMYQEVQESYPAGPQTIYQESARVYQSGSQGAYQEQGDGYQSQFNNWYQQPQSGYQPQMEPRDVYQEPVGGYQPGPQGQSSDAVKPMAADTRRIPNLGAVGAQTGNTREFPRINEEEIKAYNNRKTGVLPTEALNNMGYGMEGDSGSGAITGAALDGRYTDDKASPDEAGATGAADTRGTVPKKKKRKAAPPKRAARSDIGGGFAEGLGTAVGRFATFISRRKGIAIAIVGVIIIAIVAVVLIRREPAGDAVPGEENAVEVAHAPEMDLEEDAIPEINKLMENYYQASAQGDVDTILELQDFVSDLEKIRITKKAEYIDSFENISCYTKEGPVEGTYLLYAYNEVKLKDIDTLAPALNTYVIYRSEGGDYYIHEGDLDENTLTYFQELSTQDNVTNLCNTVQAKYNEAIASDQKLADFMESFPGLIQEAVSNSGDENSDTEEEAAGTEEPESDDAAASAEVEATDRVNIRISDSQESDRIGQVEKGTRLPLVEKKGNGWSKVVFEGQEGFVKTEFLKEVGGDDPEAPSDEGSETDTAQDAEEETQTQTSEAATSSVGKKMRAKTNVNIRSEAKEGAEKLGTLSGGQSIEVIENRSDGWSKVRYAGKDAYLKTEFLE